MCVGLCHFDWWGKIFVAVLVVSSNRLLHYILQTTVAHSVVSIKGKNTVESFSALHHKAVSLLPLSTKLQQGNVFTPVCLSFCSQGVGGVCHPPSRHPPGRHPLGRLPWADPLGRHPPAQCMLGYTHPPWAVHAGIRSTSGRYASHWNAFLFIFKLPIYTKRLSLRLQYFHLPG